MNHEINEPIYDQRYKQPLPRYRKFWWDVFHLSKLDVDILYSYVGTSRPDTVNLLRDILGVLLKHNIKTYCEYNVVDIKKELLNVICSYI